MFRFSIRDVIWLTVVVAFGACWWLDHVRLKKSAEEHSRLKIKMELTRSLLQLERSQRIWYPTIEELVEEANKRSDPNARPVPGDIDYQFPPNYPLHYGPLQTN